MRPSAALAALLLASCAAPGSAPAISIDQAWARATAPDQTSAAAYFSIVNSGGQDRLVGISSPAGDASLHISSTKDGIMRMRVVGALDIPAGSTVELRPGATHVMITGLGQQLKAGEQLPLVLSFERSGQLRVAVAVRAAGAGATP